MVEGDEEINCSFIFQSRDFAVAAPTVGARVKSWLVAAIHAFTCKTLVTRSVDSDTFIQLQPHLQKLKRYI